MELNVTYTNTKKYWMLPHPWQCRLISEYGMTLLEFLPHWLNEWERERRSGECWLMMNQSQKQIPSLGAFFACPFLHPLPYIQWFLMFPPKDKIPSSFVTNVSGIFIHVLSGQVARRVGFFNCFLRVPVVYLPCCPLSRQAEGTYRKKCAQPPCTRYFVT